MGYKKFNGNCGHGATSQLIGAPRKPTTVVVMAIMMTMIIFNRVGLKKFLTLMIVQCINEYYFSLLHIMPRVKRSDELL